MGARATHAAIETTWRRLSVVPASGSLIATTSAAAASSVLMSAPHRGSSITSRKKKFASSRTSRLALLSTIRRSVRPIRRRGRYPRYGRDRAPLPARRVRGSAPHPVPSESGQAFLALIVEVPLHLPTNDSVPVNDFFAGEKVPFAVKYSPVPPSGGM